jgi:hypothetical protein
MHSDFYLIFIKHLFYWSSSSRCLPRRLPSSNTYLPNLRCLENIKKSLDLSKDWIQSTWHNLWLKCCMEISTLNVFRAPMPQNILSILQSTLYFGSCFCSHCCIKGKTPSKWNTENKKNVNFKHFCLVGVLVGNLPPVSSFPCIILGTLQQVGFNWA